MIPLHLLMDENGYINQWQAWLMAKAIAKLGDSRTTAGGVVVEDIGHTLQTAGCEHAISQAHARGQH